MERKKIITVIPAYNEEKYIKSVIRKTQRYISRIIIVDDASTDNTNYIAKSTGAMVLRHPINLGLGGALKTGCDAAFFLGADYIITLDGDGQHDPAEIYKLLKKLIVTNSEIVFGEREFNKDMPFTKRVFNKAGNTLTKKIHNVKIKDTQTGFRIFTRNAYRKIRWKSRDYAVASEIIRNAQRNNLKYCSERIKTIYHENYKGTSIMDGIKIINKMAVLRLNK